jgi:hypothetical protein
MHDVHQAEQSLKRNVARAELVRDFRFLEKSKPNIHFNGIGILEQATAEVKIRAD